MTTEVKIKLNWCVQKLHYTKQKSIISAPSQLIIASNASLEGWGALYPGLRNGGSWASSQHKSHISVLELKTAKSAVLTFT